MGIVCTTSKNPSVKNSKRSSKFSHQEIDPQEIDPNDPSYKVKLEFNEHRQNCLRQHQKIKEPAAIGFAEMFQNLTSNNTKALNIKQSDVNSHDKTGSEKFKNLASSNQNSQQIQVQ